MKKQLLFRFIGLALTLGFGNHCYAAAIAKPMSFAGTTYTWTGAGSNPNWSNPANWSPSTGYPGANAALLIFDNVYLGATANPPVVDVPITINSTEVTGSINLILSSNLTVKGSFNIESGLVVTIAVLGFDPANPFYFGITDLVVNYNGGLVTLPQTYSQFNNINLMTNAYINNAGLITAYKATINLGFMANIINSGIFKGIGSDLNLQTSSYINNAAGGFFSFIPFYYEQNYPTPIINMDYQTKILNDGVINIQGSIVNMGKSSSIYNSQTGYFTIAGNSTVDFATNTAFGAYIANNGVFYGGTSNSPCKFNLNYGGSYIQNNDLFYLGSTSSINLTGDNSFIGTQGTFTLQSDAYGSASIGNITGNSSACFGVYNVERYISGGSNAYRSYRLLSSAVNVNDDPANNDNYSLNYAANASPTTGTDGALGGFTQGGNPTIYLYRDDIAYTNNGFNTGSFRGVANISTMPNYKIDFDGSFKLPVGNGFMFFYRGDKTNLANKFYPGTSAESTVMTSIGYLNQGQFTVKQWFQPSSSNLNYSTANAPLSGFALVGNPYPSSIDWDSFNTSTATTGIYGPGISSFMEVLDPISHNYNFYGAGFSGVSTLLDAGANVIASSQGFFVQATNPSAQLVFNESAKIATQAAASTHNLFLNALVQTDPKSYLHLKLNKDSVNVDGLLISFNKAATQAFNPNEDALYRTGNGVVSLSSMSDDGKPLAINTQALPKLQASIIPLNVSAATDGQYKLNMTAIKNIPQLYDIWLMDAFKKDSLNVRNNPTYTFNISKGDATSFGSNRFSLVIRQNPALGVKLLNFAVVNATGGLQTIWKVANEQNYTSFSVERSIDNGVTFASLNSITSSGLGIYNFLDNSPKPAATNEYRLKMTDLNGTVTYSNIIIIQYSNQSNNLVGNNIGIYPNPAHSVINVSINSGTIASTGNNAALQNNLSYGIKIVSSTGSVITSATATSATWQNSVTNLLPGTYIIQVVNSSDQSLVGKGTFIKL